MDTLSFLVAVSGHCGYNSELQVAFVAFCGRLVKPSCWLANFELPGATEGWHPCDRCVFIRVQEDWEPAEGQWSAEHLMNFGAS